MVVEEVRFTYKQAFYVYPNWYVCSMSVCINVVMKVCVSQYKRLFTSLHTNSDGSSRLGLSSLRPIHCLSCKLLCYRWSRDERRRLFKGGSSLQ